MSSDSAAAHASPSGEERKTTFDVRVWAVHELKGKNRSTWQVRWKVAGRPKPNTHTFPSRKAAESRRAELLTAVKKGEAFDVETGLPVHEALALRAAAVPPPATRTWLEVARSFADAKWDEGQAPGSRRSVAQALGAVTPALFDQQPPARLAELVREALVGWVFNTGARTTLGPDGRRTENPPPPTWAEVLDWMERHSRPAGDLANPDISHAALAALSRRIDGRPAAANTVIRRRQVFSMACQYAVARGDLTTDPLATTSWKPPKNVTVVDRRAVVNHRQATALLAAVDEIAPDLTAFFAGFYYQAFRPGENQELRANQLTLPDSGWGEALLAGNNPEISPRWSDDPDGGRQARPLKHRADGETRPVPLNPRYVALVRRHIDRFGVAPDGRVFRTAQGGPIKAARYRAVWAKARQKAFTPAEFASPLARRPYDLRHAAVSTWLNSGVPPTLVAEWAGHSVRVLLTVYAKCIVGQDEIAKRRIDTALAADDEAPSPGDPAEPDPTHGSSTPHPQPPGDGRTEPDIAGHEPAADPELDLGDSWF